jgi:uncharacterized protein
MIQKKLTFQAGATSGTVSAILTRRPDARALIVFAHGAGADMCSDFMEAMAVNLGEAGVATLRYNFPYMEQGRKNPDTARVLIETVQSAVELAAGSASGLPLFAGGKSLGGRMTSMAALPALVKGIVFFGFPLHAPGKPSQGRADHLLDVPVPMLFLQGTRDTFTELDLLRPICARLGERSTLHIVEGADHSFHMLKSAALNDDEARKELARVTADWVSRLS